MAIQEDIKRKGAESDVPEERGNEPLAGASSSPEGTQPDVAPEDASKQVVREHATPVVREHATPVVREHATPGEDTYDVALVGAVSPIQLGTRRFVYAAYFAGAIAIAFLVSKLFGFAWLKLQSWKPAVGEPRDEVLMPFSALFGALVALYCWRRTRARELAEEVASEMSKVTWPTRTEVTNGTFVVIVTTVISTVFFALMDKFWGFVTDLVYGGS